MNIPVRVNKRLQEGVKKFKPVISKIKSVDVNENDTVMVITDFLSEVLGYDKYEEITSEYAIRKTYCDLGVKVDGKIRYLIEAKAVGITLKDNHIKQALDYGANEGVDWVILTNGDSWKIFKLSFSKPISSELVYEFTLSNLNPSKNTDIELLYYLSKESICKSALNQFYEQKKALNKYYLAQVLLSPDVMNSMRKVLKKISPDVKIDEDTIKATLKKEVLKREVLDEEQAKEAKKVVERTLKKEARKKAIKSESL